MNELENKAIEIDEIVKSRYPYNQELDISPICDGIINIEQYLKSKYKILWILKEPYDEFDKDGKPCGGGWVDIPRIVDHLFRSKLYR